jgi:uncharacterized membrane-anchored protein
MNKISNWVLVLTAVLALVYVNLNTWQRQQIKLRGEILFLELAPVDPLSLVQGQYMRLGFAIEKRYDSTPEDQEVIQNGHGNVLAVISLDDKRIGTLTGLLAPNRRQQQPHGDDTLELQVHTRLFDFDTGSYWIHIKQNSFLFQENTEDRYALAKYGMFRVHEDGRYVLVDLADEHLRPLTPKP